MKSKLNTAIDLAYELIKQEWLNGSKHSMNLAVALDQLEPYYKNPMQTYDEERKAYWLEMMDMILEEKLEKLTEAETDDMVSCLTYGNDDSIDTISDAIYDAAVCCELTDKLYGEG